MLIGLTAAAAALALITPAAVQAQQAAFSAPQRLTVPSLRPTFEAPSGGLDANGGGLLAWDQSRERRSQVVVAAAPPGGGFAPPQVLDRGGAPKVAVNADGYAVLVYTKGRATVMRRGDTSGRFGPPVVLARKRSAGAIAMAGDGTVALVYANYERPSIVQLVDREGRRGAIRRFDLFRFEGTYLVAEDGQIGFPDSQLQAGADGTIALVTKQGLLERRPGELTFAHAHRPFRGRFDDPRVTVGPAGRIGMTAVGKPFCIGEYGCVGEVWFAERPPGAAGFGARVRAPVERYPVDETRRRVVAGVNPRVAYGADGAPVLTWTEDEAVCTVCDMDGPDGPLILWRPGEPRRQLRSKPSTITTVPTGDAVAAVAEEYSLASDERPFERSNRELLLLRTTGAEVVGRPPIGASLLAAGGGRLLFADVEDEQIVASFATFAR
jgi:hypothetical protein